MKQIKFVDTGVFFSRSLLKLSKHLGTQQISVYAKNLDFKAGMLKCALVNGREK